MPYSAQIGQPSPARPVIAPDAPWLAPLAGFSDLPFRLLCREQGAAVCVTEMVSAKGLCYATPGTPTLLATSPDDAPLVVQVFGAEPDFMARAMDDLLERGFRWFDLNAGCPVPKVAKQGAGARLLEEPGQVVELARVMRERIKRAGFCKSEGSGGVGVKYRLGWNETETYLELGSRLEDAGAAWLTLHPRTGKQSFSGRADWDALSRLKARVAVPVMASGDLFTAEDGVACLKATGVDGVMFARGALRDPAIFGRFRALLAGREPAPRTAAALSRLLHRHGELIQTHQQHENQRHLLLAMRGVMVRYARGLPGVAALRERMVRCDSWEEFQAIAGAVAGLPDEER